MQFHIMMNNKLIGSFRYFHEAWITIHLNMKCFATIIGPNKDDKWIVNPRLTN